jgi:adenylosuccinate synthase
MAKARPVYKDFPGWKISTCQIRSYADLPPAAKDYIKAIEDACGAPVRIVSVGSGREETLFK